ncbi:MAG: PKD domain-containing protein [Bacteroidia bacterium]
MRSPWLWGLWGLVWAHYPFYENKGQEPPWVLYKTQAQNAFLYFERNRVSIVVLELQVLRSLHGKNFSEEPVFIPAHFFQIEWIGAAPEAIIGEKVSPTLHHWLCTGRWAKNVRAYQQLRYKNLYPGIDLVVQVYQGKLKLDWEIRAQADPKQIRWRYVGVPTRQVGDSLELITSIGIYYEKIPAAYTTNGKAISVAYEKSGDAWQFRVSAVPKKPWVIDPVLVFATYSGSYSDNWGYTATYDLRGNGYSGGIVNDLLWNPNPNATYFPVTPGALQVQWGGGTTLNSTQPLFYASDIALWATNPTGTQMRWATYLGGNHNEQPHSLVVDNQYRLYVLGATRSTNFPTTPSAFQPAGGGNIDIIVSCLDSTGSTLYGSTYLGGSGIDGLNRAANLNYFYADDGRGEVIVSDTAVFIASSTRSTNFPVTVNAFQSVLLGAQDGIVATFSKDLSQLYHATYLGGALEDAAYSVRPAPSGQVYVAGGTKSSNFPIPSSAHQATFGGVADGYVVALGHELDTLLYGTFIGTSAYDQVFVVEIDRWQKIWVCGHTEGNLTSTAGAYQVANGKQFIAQYESSLDVLLRRSVWGSVGRNIPNITISAFAADRCGYIYVSGWGGLFNGSTIDGSTFGLPTTPGAYQTTTDGADFYLAIFDYPLANLVYASFFGGSVSPEHVDGGTSRFDPRGIVYQSVCAGCPGNQDFPATPGAISNTNQSPNCNNALFKLDMGWASPTIAQFTATPNRGCAPLTVEFENLSFNTETVSWDFGNGQTSTLQVPPPQTYTQPGIYVVTMVTYASLSCNLYDTARIIIQVLPPPDPDFSYDTTTCELGVQFYGPPGADGYEWDFGDATTSTQSSPYHLYNLPGSYRAKLMVRRGPCLDSMTKWVHVTLPTRAFFQVQIDTCRGIVSVQNFSYNATSWLWDWGDGSQDTAFAPGPHAYAQPGIYVLTLIVKNDSCQDTFRLPLPYLGSPLIDFQTVGSSCDLTQTFAVSDTVGTYVWDFGDGTTAVGDEVVHTFSSGGTYQVTLRRILGSCTNILTRPIPVRAGLQAFALWEVDTCNFTLRARAIIQDSAQVLWLLGDGNQVSGNPLQYTYAQGGNYVVYLVVSDSVCRDTFGFVLPPLGPSEPDFTYELTNCNQLKLIRTQGWNTLWIVGGDTLSGDTIVKHMPRGSGSWEVVLASQPGTSCERRKSQILPWPPAPMSDSVVYQLRLCEDRITFSLVGRQVPIVWHIADQQWPNLPYLSLPWQTWKDKGFVGWVVLATSKECYDTLHFAFSVEEIAARTIFIPNVFTPNSDGINDVFEIRGQEQSCAKSLSIYDRWGNLLYQTTTSPLRWNGTLEGKPAPEGTYVYVVDFTTFRRAGTVSLIR